MATAAQHMSPAEVGSWVREYIATSNNPDLLQYGSLVLDVLPRFLWTTQYLMDVGKLHDQNILEVGCGFGWGAVAVSMLGNNHVVASDIRETMTSVVQERVAMLRSRGARVDVDVLLADICRFDAFAGQGPFDGILTNEAIEHVHDLDAMFATCARLLRKGGRLVILNDANVLNEKEVNELRSVWERRDQSWEYIAQLKKERPIENRDIEPYAVMRENIVRQANPALDSYAASRLVESTAGLREREIEALARRYVPGMELPEPPESSWCRNPVTGEYCERLLNPYNVAESLGRHGFETRVLHNFRRMPLRLLNGVRLRFLNRWLFNLRSPFVIAAVRV